MCHHHAKVRLVNGDGALGDRPTELILKQNGDPRALLANAIIILRTAPQWSGVLGHDTFALSTVALAPPPWEMGRNSRWEPRAWTARDDVMTAVWLQHQGVLIGHDTAQIAVEAVAHEHEFHPIRELPRRPEVGWAAASRTMAFDLPRGRRLALHASGGASLPRQRRRARSSARLQVGPADRL
jgi:hypothetical protein